MVVALRVDDRLIHGQVALAWSKALGSEGILIANDAVCRNEVQKMALKMATPPNVKLLIKPVSEAVAVLNNPKGRNMKIMVLTSTVRDALEICKGVTEITEVNLAGTGRLDGVGAGAGEKTVLVKSSVFLRPEEVECLRELIGRGVYVYNQQLPTHDRQDLSKALV